MSAVRVELRGRVLVCAFNRPLSLNSVDQELLSGWMRALQIAESDYAVKVFVTLGNGAGWCSGLDLSVAERHISAAPGPRSRLSGVSRELFSLDQVPGAHADESPVVREETHDWYGLNSLAHAVHKFEKPTIAAISGAAVGGGMALALLHDIRFATATARFSTRFSALGMASEQGMLRLMVSQIGLGRTLDLALSSRFVDAAEAARLGLVEHLVDSHDVEGAALAYAQQLADLPGHSLTAIRRLARDATEGTFDDYLRREWVTQDAAFATPEAHDRFLGIIRGRQDEVTASESGRPNPDGQRWS